MYRVRLKEAPKALHVIVDSAIDHLFDDHRPMLPIEHKYLATPVDIVSENEIYLLKRNPDYNPSDPKSPVMLRDRRICGYIRGYGQLEKAKKLRCLSLPGAQTNHSGEGYCAFHEGRQNNVWKNRERFRLLEGYEAKGWGLRIKELHALIPDLLTDPKLGDIDEEIVILNTVLKHLINQDMIDPEEIRKTTETISKVKAARQKIKTEKLLMDINSLRLFVSAMIDVLKKNLGAAQYSKILQEFESLAIPINKQMQGALIQQTVTMQDADATISDTSDIM